MACGCGLTPAVFCGVITPVGKPLNAVHCIILQNQPPGVAAPSTGASSLSVEIGTIFGCVSPHSLAGAPPQTRPGWGMEPAPERKGVGGAGERQGGKAEQIHTTRYHVTLTEGGEISREQRAEPIAESRACTRCTSAGARNHIEPHISPREPAERKRRASEPLPSGVHHARLNAAFRPVHSSTVGCMTQNCKRVHFSLAGCTKGCTRTA